jgi:hypothetical protein
VTKKPEVYSRECVLLFPRKYFSTQLTGPFVQRSSTSLSSTARGRAALSDVKFRHEKDYGPKIHVVIVAESLCCKHKMTALVRVAAYSLVMWHTHCFRTHPPEDNLFSNTGLLSDRDGTETWSSPHGDPPLPIPPRLSILDIRLCSNVHTRNLASWKRQPHLPSE